MSIGNTLLVLVIIIFFFLTIWYIVKNLPTTHSESKNCCEIYDKIYNLRSVNDDKTAGTVACYPIDKTKLSDLGKWAFGKNFEKHKCPVNKEQCHWSRNYSGCKDPQPDLLPVYGCKDPKATNYNGNPKVISRKSMCIYPKPPPSPPPPSPPPSPPPPSPPPSRTKMEYPCTDSTELSGAGFPEHDKAYCRTRPHQNFNTRGMNASDLTGCIGDDLHSTWYYHASRTHINPDNETATINEGSEHSAGHTLTVPAKDDNFSTSIDCIYDETACMNDVRAALKAGMERTQDLLNSKPLFQAYHWGGYGSVPMSHLHTVTSEYGNRITGTSPMVDSIQCEGSHDTPSTLLNKVNSNGVCVFIDMDSDGTYKNLDSNAEFICKNRYDPIKN